MGDRLRLSVGVMGNAASLLLYAAPILTFVRVVKKRSTEKFSCIPYIITLSNCLLYTWYGLPIVSHKWENFPLVTINGLGILFEFSFISIYFWFSEPREKIKVSVAMVPVILHFTIAVTISTFVFHDHPHRKMFTGCIGLLSSVGMYASPLVVMKQVIQTKSVEFMPFYLSFFSFLATSLWLAYGLLSHDLFIASPNFVGVPLGILQLLLYFKYKNNDVTERPEKWDVEKNEEKSKQMQLVVNENTNGKS